MCKKQENSLKANILNMIRGFIGIGCVLSFENGSGNLPIVAYNKAEYEICSVGHNYVHCRSLATKEKKKIKLDDFASNTITKIMDSIEDEINFNIYYKKKIKRI